MDWMQRLVSSIIMDYSIKTQNNDQTVTTEVTYGVDSITPILLIKKTWHGKHEKRDRIKMTHDEAVALRNMLNAAISIS